MVGCTEGTIDGIHDGLPVGLVEGDNEGIIVGVELTVGARVGGSVGRMLTTSREAVTLSPALSKLSVRARGSPLIRDWNKLA